MTKREITASRIRGRTVEVSLVGLSIVWGMLRQEVLELRDVRAWLGLQEMRERRSKRYSQKSAKDWRACQRHTFEELAVLMGTHRAKARTSVRRLERAGVVRWSESAIEFIDVPDSVGEGESAELWKLWSAAPKAGKVRGKKKLHLPRRVLRFLARGQSRGLTAVMLAQCLRCLFFHKDQGWATRGRVKASWNAEAFDISVRSVKRARADLVARGWLVERETLGQWDLQHYGSNFEINAWWAGTDGELVENDRAAAPVVKLCTPKVAPGSKRIERQMSPPIKDLSLPTELKNQKPKPQAAQTPGLVSSRKKVGGRTPSFFDVTTENLKSCAEVLVLFEHAQRLGVVGCSEMDRLNFVAAAVHARRIGERPPALFVQLIRKRLWENITHEDEDQARSMLFEYTDGVKLARKRRTSYFEDEDDEGLVPIGYIASLTGLGDVLTA